MLGMHLVWTAHNVLPHEQVFADDVSARRALVRPVISSSPTQNRRWPNSLRWVLWRRSAVIQHGPIGSEVQRVAGYSWYMRPGPADSCSSAA